MAPSARGPAGLATMLAAALALGCASPSAQSQPAAPEPSAASPPKPARSSSAEPSASAAPAPVPPPALPSKLEGPGWLGVELAAREPMEAGVLLRDITPGSPAQQAGLAPGDVLLSIDGEAVNRPSDVVALIASRRAGSRVAVAYRRGESDRLAAVVLGARPDAEQLMHKNYVGSPAPPFRSLTTVQGSVPADIKTLRGKVVVVEFWASWCMPCRLSAPKLNAWHDRWKAEGLEVVGITMDPASLSAQAAVEFGIRYGVASDESGSTSRAYRAMSIPTLFVIDRAGVVREVVVGFSTARLAQTERLIEELVSKP